MQIPERLKEAIPKLVLHLLLRLLRPMRNKIGNKYVAELSFWKSRFKIDNGIFDNAGYSKIMLAMAEEPNDGFLRGKIVADFGCGPRGSLVWISSASLRIGIDVLADDYADKFTDNIISHGMIYLKSTEKVIPLPSEFVDVMFTLNAMDHVNSFPDICREIIRVLKPGGDFIGSFNLEEPATLEEPQKLNEIIIKDNLLKYLDVKSYRITNQGPEECRYKHFWDGNFNYEQGRKGILWVKAKKIK